ncbi:MAG: RES family NAD+ phosphorylase [Prosthecobacter sp.]
MKMHINWKALLDEASVKAYTKAIEINADWVSYRYAPNPYGASLQPSRYNVAGQSGFYMASGVQCAQAEVPNHEERDLYSVKPQTIYAFDVLSFATDKNLDDVLLAAKNSGGHQVCQELSNYLTATRGLTGIFYQSYQMLQRGQTGYCVCVLPRPEQTIDESFMQPYAKPPEMK